MKFAGTALHTDNVPRLVEFYSKVLRTKADGDNVHSAFPDYQLAIRNPGNINNDKYSDSQRYVTLMFEVDDVDEEYKKLINIDPPVNIASKPTTYPWGARAFSFQDPDGNNVDFLTPAKQ